MLKLSTIFILVVHLTCIGVCSATDVTEDSIWWDKQDGLMLKVEGMSNQGKIVGQLIDIDDKSPSKGTMIPVVGWFYDPYIAFSTKIDVDFRGEFGVAAWVGAIDGGVMIVRWTRIYKDGMLNKVEKKNGKFQLTQPKMYELLLRDRRIKLKKIFN